MNRQTAWNPFRFEVGFAFATHHIFKIIISVFPGVRSMKTFALLFNFRLLFGKVFIFELIWLLYRFFSMNRGDQGVNFSFWLSVFACFIAFGGWAPMRGWTSIKWLVAAAVEHAGCSWFVFVNFVFLRLNLEFVLAFGAQLWDVRHINLVIVLFLMAGERLTLLDSLVYVKLLEHLFHYYVNFAPVFIMHLILLPSPRLHLPLPKLFQQLAFQ